MEAMLNSIESNIIIPKGINRHPFKADKLLTDLLDKLGLTQTVNAYNQVSDKFWYA